MPRAFVAAYFVVVLAIASASAQSASLAVVHEMSPETGEGDWTAPPQAANAGDVSNVVASPKLSASRLLAGVREYPDAIISALRTVADNPDLVAKLAADPGLVDKPAELGSTLTPEMKSALEAMRPVPDVLRIAADHAALVRELRGYYFDAPEGMDARLKQLRVDYLRSAGAASGEWQRVIQSDPNALADYRVLLDRYCQEQQKKDEHFPVVYALKQDYYFACPPDAVILEFASDGSPPESLMRLMETWYEDFGPESRDAAILREGVAPTAAVLLTKGSDASLIGAQKPEARRAMWTSDKKTTGALGMIPVVLQPLTDQPFEARLAFAVYEHGRMWAGAPVSDSLPEARTGDDWVATTIEPAPAAPPLSPVTQQPAPTWQPPATVAPQAPATSETVVVEDVPVVSETVYVEPVYVEPVVVSEVYDYGYDTVAIGGYYGSGYSSYWPGYWGGYYAGCPIYAAPFYGAYYGCGPYYGSYYGGYYGSCGPSWGFSFGFSYSNYGCRPYYGGAYRSYCGAYNGRYVGHHGGYRGYSGSYYGAKVSHYGRGSGYGRTNSGGRDSYRGGTSNYRSSYGRGTDGSGYRSRSAGRSGVDGSAYRSGSTARSGADGGRNLPRVNNIDGSPVNRSRGGVGNSAGGNARRSDGSGNVQRQPRGAGNDALRNALNRRSPGGSGQAGTARNDAARRISPGGAASASPRREARSSSPRGISPQGNQGGRSLNNGANSGVKRGATVNPQRSMRSSPGGSGSQRSFSPSRGGGAPSRSISPNRGGGGSSRSFSPGRSSGAGGGSRSMGRGPSGGGGGSRSMSRGPSGGGGGSRSMSRGFSGGGGSRSMGGSRGGGGGSRGGGGGSRGGGGRRG